MTSRNITSAINRSNRRTNLAPSSNTTAIMVQINWTSAAVVRMTARKDVKLTIQVVSELRGVYSVVRESAPMSISAGKVLHFVASGRGDGWYYLVSVVNNELRCSCPAHHFNRSCKHLEAVESFCVQHDRAEMSRAGGEARVELVEVEKEGFVYPMVRVISPCYVGKLHYTWTEEHKINRYKAQPSIIAEMEVEIQRAQAWKRAA